MALIEDLKRYGLSDKEARVYLATLELGETTVQQISQKSGVNRATTYVVLETLKEKKLTDEVQSGKKRFVVALPPDKLQEAVTKRKEEIKEQRKNLIQMMPELRKEMAGAAARPKVKMYEGKEGLIAIHQDFLISGPDEILRIMPETYYFDQIGSYRETFQKESAIRKLKFRVISTTKSATSIGKVEKQDNGLMQILSMSAKDFPLEGGMDIYGNRTVFYSLEEQATGVVVEDQQIADTYRSIFELAWAGGLK
ncbi:TrmB family transcriptional regulator [Patescibacteria group bacterium]